jgi:hypothetical protein
MTVMTCIQGKERRFAEFEASILSRKRNCEIFAKKRWQEKLVFDVTEY